MPKLPNKNTFEAAEKKIKEVEKLLSHIDVEYTENFQLLLSKRKKDFMETLASHEKKISVYEKKKITSQYYFFADTLYKCMKYPANDSDYIKAYFNRIYYPIGNNTEKGSSPLNSLFYTGIYSGTLLTLASVAAMIVCPQIGFIIFPIGMTLLISNLFLLLAKEVLTINNKKNEDKTIFEKGSDLLRVHPEVNYEREDKEEGKVISSLVTTSIFNAMLRHP
ncbi:hypothetical protein [Legionella sp.]|uniref:hypothetical protein n=1 Tax=Legionella sp. TaxID=459 RepID=UPI003C8EFC1F